MDGIVWIIFADNCEEVLVGEDRRESILNNERKIVRKEVDLVDCIRSDSLVVPISEDANRRLLDVLDEVISSLPYGLMLRIESVHCKYADLGQKGVGVLMKLVMTDGDADCPRISLTREDSFSVELNLLNGKDDKMKLWDVLVENVLAQIRAALLDLRDSHNSSICQIDNLLNSMPNP